MAIVTIKDLTIGFRGPLLLDTVSCRMQPGQRIGLLGATGPARRRCMRILRGDVEPAGGEVQLGTQTRVSLLPQDVPQDVRGSVWEVVERGLSTVAAGQGYEEEADWKKHQRVTQMLSRMNLDGTVPFKSCPPA